MTCLTHFPEGPSANEKIQIFCPVILSVCADNMRCRLEKFNKLSKNAWKSKNTAVYEINWLIWLNRWNWEWSEIVTEMEISGFIEFRLF